MSALTAYELAVERAARLAETKGPEHPETRAALEVVADERCKRRRIA